MSRQEFSSLLSTIRDQIRAGRIDEALNLLEELHPADQADLVEDLSLGNQLKVLTELDPSASADVMEEMDDSAAVAVAEIMPPEQLAEILDVMEVDEAVDVVSELPEDQVTEILDQMSDSDDIVSLLQYPKDTAGGIMTSVVITIRPDWSVERTMQKLRTLANARDSSYYLFVTDKSRKLLGVVGLRKLVTLPPDQNIKDVMDTTLVTVRVDTDQEECALILTKYSLLVLPVVDLSYRLVGVITADDLMEVSSQEATEDMYLMVGISGEEQVWGSIRDSVSKRLPWLLINMITLFFAILVIGVFEPIIAGLVVLAVFLPLVPGEGGNAGSQTATVIIRGIALSEVETKDWGRAMKKEVIVSGINGVIVGIVTGIAVYVWKLNFQLAVALAIAMTLNFILAGVIGVVVPLALKRLNYDPALASAAFVTAFTDTFGFLFFLGIAAILI